MDGQYTIEVKNLTKRFKIYFDKGSSFKERLLFQNRRRFEERLVLDDISLRVKRGESIGIIGENGCGKSTLLKLLSRILYPDSGSVTMRGRVSALIELGAGFHPDMSGRENIYTNASIFGLTKAEIDARLQQIIDFSELGDYIDNPVRTYSSGMYMRLAFSVAINVDADILLVDEILAVGDAAFQAKCFRRLREIKASGVTIVIVSHSLTQVEQFCDRAFWICDGKIRAEGAPRDVNPAYLAYMGERAGKSAESAAENVKASDENATEGSPECEAASDAAPAADPDTRWGDKAAEILSAVLKNSRGEKSAVFATGEQATLEIRYRAKQRIDEAVCGIAVFRSDDLHCYGTNTLLDRAGGVVLEGEGTITLTLSSIPLLPGEYTLDLALHAADGFAYDYWRRALSLTVYSDVQDVGILRIPHTWAFTKEADA